MFARAKAPFLGTLSPDTEIFSGVFATFQLASG